MSVILQAMAALAAIMASAQPFIDLIKSAAGGMTLTPADLAAALAASQQLRDAALVKLDSDIKAAGG